MVWRGDRSENTEQVEPTVGQEPFFPDAPPEEHEYSDRTIFASGWFRALLAVAALAIALVATLPYILDWFEPAAPSVKAPVQARSVAPVSSRPVDSPSTESTAEKAASAAKAQSASETPSARPTSMPPAVTASAPVAQDAPRALAGTRTVAVQRPQPRDETTFATRNGTYWVQLGVFKDPVNAARLATQVRGEGFSTQVASVRRSDDGVPAQGTSGTTYYVVRAGAFSDRTRAIAARDDLKTRGHAGFLSEGAAR
jgi:cell division septation protein DedD